MDLFLIITLTLLILAVVGSVVPMVPGALLSIIGILVYWWSTGFTSPGNLFLGAFILTGLGAMAADYFGGSIAAKAGGATTKTSLIAGVIGFILFFVLGPIGIFVGVAGTVFIREFLRTGDAEQSVRAAFYSALGVLGSTVVQLVITVSLLVAFIVALIL